MLDVDSFEPLGMVAVLLLAIGMIPPPRMGPKELARLGSKIEAKLRSVARPWNNASPVEGAEGSPGAND